MEEADLLKERLQAITDKRRIQEDIARKRRQIEEEKLKLQYIKKKALREQWLMDGLSQQSEQEQEAMRLQAQDEQQQSDQLQSNILRIEREIEELETQELNISANEELVLKRLKEVERTPEDIIKELNADVHPDVTHHVTSSLPDLPSCTSVAKVKTLPVCQAEGEEPKRATFAMEISVELDKKTGRTQVVSAASITPETVQGRGLKVYDDGRKSVYALHPEGGVVQNGAMTPLEVEELLRQATDQDLNTEVQYHPPVYSAPYTGNTRPSTPRTPSKRPTPTPSPSLTENQQGPDLSRAPVNQDPPSGALPPTSNSPAQSDRRRTPQCDRRTVSSNHAALVSVTAQAGGLPVPTQLLYRAVDTHSPSVKSPGDVTRHLPSEGVASLNLVTPPPGESQPVTMIFMGYEKAEDEEDEDIQAELVVIGNSDDDDDEDESDEGAEPVSFHPQGYRSRVFQPPVGRATVQGPQDQSHHWDHDLNLDLDLDQDQLLRPTFTHKTRSRRGSSEMKLCSTGR